MSYTKKTFGIYWFKLLFFINKKLLKTYPDNEDCARCRDCGKTVHDWHTDDDLFEEVVGSLSGVWCWDCFCSRARMKGIGCYASVGRSYIC